MLKITSCDFESTQFKLCFYHGVPKEILQKLVNATSLQAFFKKNFYRYVERKNATYDKRIISVAMFRSFFPL